MAVSTEVVKDLPRNLKLSVKKYGNRAAWLQIYKVNHFTSGSRGSTTFFDLKQSHSGLLFMTYFGSVRYRIQLNTDPAKSLHPDPVPEQKTHEYEPGS